MNSINKWKTDIIKGAANLFYKVHGYWPTNELIQKWCDRIGVNWTVKFDEDSYDSRMYHPVSRRLDCVG